MQKKKKFEIKKFPTNMTAWEFAARNNKKKKDTQLPKKEK